MSLSCISNLKEQLSEYCSWEWASVSTIVVIAIGTLGGGAYLLEKDDPSSPDWHMGTGVTLTILGTGAFLGSLVYCAYRVNRIVNDQSYSPIGSVSNYGVDTDQSINYLGD